MATKNSFVITIGDQGSIIALHKSDEIKNKIFVEKLDDNLKTEIKILLQDNKSIPIYILLDTIDQIYKRKTYPFVKKHDLIHLIKRDILADSSKESLKNYIIIEDKKNKNRSARDKKWECLFVSSSIEKSVNEWLQFLLEMPNHLIGIYMAPIESFNLFNSLKDNIKSSSKLEIENEDKVYCFVLQSKVSGIRQILFNEQSILFTRLASHKLEDSDFIEKYEKDIYSTFEYLKRILPNIQIKDLEIVNILPQEALGQISAMRNIDFNFINYTPYQAANIAFGDNSISRNSNFCDLLISRSFANTKKKILQFKTAQISLLEKLFFGTKISYYVNLFLLLTIGTSCLFVIQKINELEEIYSLAEIDKLGALQSLNKTTSLALNSPNTSGEESIIEVDRILDIGKLHEILIKNQVDIPAHYSQFKFLKNYGIKISNFSYNSVEFNEKFPSKEIKYSIVIKGKIHNKNGDAEDLFKNFDGFTSEFKKTFENHKTYHSELPRNIDFAKKYYDFPIEFTIEKNN